MLLIVTTLKLIAEIALMAFAGRWLLGHLAGERREQNLFYGVLQVLVSPFLSLARRVAPARMDAARLPVLACLLLSAWWLAMTVLKIATCLQIGPQLCR